MSATLVFGGIVTVLFVLFLASTRRAPLRLQHAILIAVTDRGVAFSAELALVLRLGPMTISPWLRQLERDGLLRAFEDHGAAHLRGGRPRVYYQITAKGEAFLQARSEAP